MIDRFYARHLSAMMAPERIIGLRVAEKKTSHTRQKKSKTNLVGNSREKIRRRSPEG
jgi:hypothetical protein